ncbi:hypothetical protein B0H11DRAFT_2226467 [Mycena galericulata]|nr:hypothetical protein B0H11DRAFT_2226467 [Mycena galericulata]
MSYCSVPKRPREAESQDTVPTKRLRRHEPEGRPDEQPSQGQKRKRSRSAADIGPAFTRQHMDSPPCVELKRGDADHEESPSPLEVDAGMNPERKDSEEGVPSDEKQPAGLSYMRRRHLHSVTPEVPPQTMTAAQDKAYKRETLARKVNGQPLDALLMRWLNRYMPLPTKVRPPGYVAGGAVKERVRKRAEARTARVAHLMALRAAPKTPGLILFHPDPPIYSGDSSRCTEDLKRREDARARRIRVAELVRLREKGRVCRKAVLI